LYKINYHPWLVLVKCVHVGRALRPLGLKGLIDLILLFYLFFGCKTRHKLDTRNYHRSQFAHPIYISNFQVTFGKVPTNHTMACDTLFGKRIQVIRHEGYMWHPCKGTKVYVELLLHVFARAQFLHYLSNPKWLQVQFVSKTYCEIW
jgi:hypothetical protein